MFARASPTPSMLAALPMTNKLVRTSSVINNFARTASIIIQNRGIASMEVRNIETKQQRLSYNKCFSTYSSSVLCLTQLPFLLVGNRKINNKCGIVASLEARNFSVFNCMRFSEKKDIGKPLYSEKSTDYPEKPTPNSNVEDSKFNDHQYSKNYSKRFTTVPNLFGRSAKILVSIVIVLSVIDFFYSKQIKEFIAKKLGSYITRNTMFTVVFEEATILPGWNKLYFKKCFISRRPKRKHRQPKEEISERNHDDSFSSYDTFKKGSQEEAIHSQFRLEEEHEKSQSSTESDQNEYLDDGNYTQYDITIDEMNLSISFMKWLNGKGILKDVELKKIRGIVDRTHVYWDIEHDDVRNYLNFPTNNDLNVENFKMEDLFVTLLNPNNFRPINISIYNCQLKKLRQNWLFIDFLNAENINGSYDNSLFTINKVYYKNNNSNNSSNSMSVATDNSDNVEEIYFLKDNPNKSVSKFRIDGLNVDHLNSGVTGPFGWIVKGNVDISSSYQIPDIKHYENLQSFYVKVIQDIFDKISKSNKNADSNSESTLSENNLPLWERPEYEKEYHRYYTDADHVYFDTKIKFNGVKAKLPANNDLSYMNYALIRPVIGYINSRQTYMEILFRLKKIMSDFNGSWTSYDCFLMDDVSEQMYLEFEDYAIDEELRVQRLKKIGFWTLQVMLQVVLFGLSTIG